MNEKKRKIVILGSTGSIGTQALDVIERYPERFEAYALTANSSVDLLAAQARKFSPEIVVVANEAKYKTLKSALADLPIKVWCGTEAICQVTQSSEVDMVLTAMVGFSGLMPTISAIKAGKAIALANKETLVVAGELITQLALAHRVPVLPVDSEHSAIFQCLNGEGSNKIEKIWLTASGGPFRAATIQELKQATRAQALKHPNWNMGEKVTIDSATLMNKGFEMIEARWLFDVSPSRIQVLLHPQSIIHSMVQFSDTSVMAQLGQPDMRVPIQYAFSYPERLETPIKPLDFFQLKSFTFEAPDTHRFKNLLFAYQAIEKGGNMPCILNAANEIAVAAFLKEQIGFLQMSQLIEETMSKAQFISNPSLDDYLQTNEEARAYAEEYSRAIKNN